MNTPDGINEKAILLGTYDFDQISTEADSNFWTVYLLGAYQMQTEEDCDGYNATTSNADCTAGQVDDLNGVGVSVFLEAANEFTVVGPGDAPAGTTVHELGHLFNGSHSDGGIMSSQGATVSFSPSTLFRIRTVTHP